MMLNISGYQITEEIYTNFKRVVYRGIRLCDRQPVILKCLQVDAVTPTEIARLQHEYDITTNLNLSGVVQALAFLNENSCPVLILPDFGGISLKDFLKQRKLSLRKFLGIAIDLAQTLGELHRQNIIHKDIKPSNIIIKSENLEIKITDFAIASQLSRESAIVTHPNLLEGTLAYQLQHFSIIAYWCGQPLAELEPKLRTYHQELRELNQVTTANYCLIHWQNTLILLGQSEEKIPLRQDSYESEIISKALASNDWLRLCQFFLYRFTLTFFCLTILQRLRNADKHRQCWQK